MKLTLAKAGANRVVRMVSIVAVVGGFFVHYDHGTFHLVEACLKCILAEEAGGRAHDKEKLEPVCIMYVCEYVCMYVGMGGGKGHTIRRNWDLCV